MSENEKKPVDMAEIPDEDLEQVSGGFVVQRGSNCWEIIKDSTGEVVGTEDNEEDALWAARRLGLSLGSVSDEKLAEIRDRHRLEIGDYWYRRQQM